jgi:hypothetical protein
MSIPKSITILGHKTTVKQVKALPGDAEVDTLGVADLTDDIIYLHKAMSENAKQKILLHEIFHHAMWRNGVDQTLNGSQLECLCQMFTYLHLELKRQKL